MGRMFFALLLTAMFAGSAAGQGNKTLPLVTLTGTNPQLFFANPARVASRRAGYVPFCPPGSCLYYAGDFDSNNSNANGLFNADDTGDGLEGLAWVGVRPDRDVTVTGSTFVEILTSEYAGTNPTSFSVQVGIKPGQAGKTICNTSGNATFAIYGNNQLPTYSYTIKKLGKSCKLRKGEVYYINLWPASSNGYGFVVNLVEAKPQNHYGWKNDLNDCYFNSASYGANYAMCDSEGYFPELSIALTGKK